MGTTSVSRENSEEATITDVQDGIQKTTKRDPPTNSEESGNNRKRTKKEGARFRRDPRDYDENRDDRSRPAHEGSYASPAQRALLGMSDDVINENRIVVPPDTQTLKRKVVLLLGFLGTNYGGFQINTGQKTLQAEIELALFKAGLLSELNFGSPQKYSWSSSARTDKGVHACSQVCSLKVEFPLLEGGSGELDDACIEAARERIQERLPDEIQVLDLLRTTRNFCAKTQRDRVRYQYMIPSFLFHPDYRSLLEEHGIPLDGRSENAKAPLTTEEIAKLAGALKSYRSTPEQRATLQAALKKYQGTHPFHNFTKGLKIGQAQANRFIEYFRVQEPVVLADGIEWIPTQVLGQSFLLHQIRKMISLAVDVTRGVASLEFMDKALGKTESVVVSLAPAQGLFLEMSYFDGYNRRKASQNPDLPDLDFLREGPARDRWEAFRTRIRKHIVEEEIAQGNFLQYLYQQECLFDYKGLYQLESKGTVDVCTTIGATDENTE